MELQNPTSPVKFSSQATDSPSKISAPSRRSRNLPSSRVHDIEFATEISTSLLAQVRQLQALMADRDETLKNITTEKSKLEHDAEGFAQRLRAMDESEQRYKDENWNLETQTHELIASAKEMADKEQRLQQSLAAVSSEKRAVQRELDDLAQANVKLTEEHAAVRKAHDLEIASVRKNLNATESSRSDLERKVDDLTAQNQELAKAMAGRFRTEEMSPERGIGSEPEALPRDRSDVEHSPPPSPTKGLGRHTALETETLKSSLHHAHRMIQNLKNNVHREKTEKADLKRMLQEARDELDVRSREPGDSKRVKSRSTQDLSKKIGRSNMLGIVRNSRTDVVMDDPAWEDHNGESPTQRPVMKSIENDLNNGDVQQTDVSDAYQTANETEDAFETANERDDPTENEDAQAYGGFLAGQSSEELTETETGTLRGGTVRGRQSSQLATAKPGDRSSFMSTASTSADDDYESMKTSFQSQPQRYRLRMNRNSRRSRISSQALSDSNPSTARNSPTAFLSNGDQGNQSLFAELGDFNDGDSAEDDGTPSRRSVISQRSIPGLRSSTGLQHVLTHETEPPVPQIPMVDSSMMTEPWDPVDSAQAETNPRSMSDSISGASPLPTSTPQTKDVGTQRTPSSVRYTDMSSPKTPNISELPRTVWDQPLEQFAGPIPTFGPAFMSTPPSARSAISEAETNVSLKHMPNDFTPLAPATSTGQPPDPVQSIPQTPPTSRPHPEPTPPRLGLSPIYILETTPIEPAPALVTKNTRKAAKFTPFSDAHALGNSWAIPFLSDNSDSGSTSLYGKAKDVHTPRVAEDDTSHDMLAPPVTPDRIGKMPFEEVAGNAAPRDRKRQSLRAATKPVVVDTADESSQTILSAQQLDAMLRARNRQSLERNLPEIKTTPTAASMKPLSDIGAISPPMRKDRLRDGSGSPRGRTFEQSSFMEAAPLKEAAPLVKTLRRPNSSGSVRASIGPMPPLPADHRQAIAAAVQKGPETTPMVSNIMGPPIQPASAYRSNPLRPRTPSEQNLNKIASPTSNSRNGTTPRPRYSRTRSQVSRRSSVSSFASELDERFNIRMGGMPMPDGFDSNSTDPRMIQAITQTMIGEYLWKYTRKAGRPEMSSNRHRRFFWVHPYTRTLYWSDRDPSTAGRAELKAKSVAIEAVRVITDDNPMPPGLHRKSLIVMTPGRSVKFTATTGQRHETWFNAISYLLMRTGPDGNATADAGNTTDADVEEFNPSFGRRSRMSRSRMSLSSYASRRGRNVPTGSAASRHSMRATASGQDNPSLQPAPPTSVRGRRDSSTQGASFSSRLSNYFRPSHASVPATVTTAAVVGMNGGATAGVTNGSNAAVNGGTATSTAPSVRNSTNSRRSGRGSMTAGGYVVSDSAEDLRRVISRQERESARLENVRACCDGGCSFPFPCIDVPRVGRGKVKRI